VRYIEPFAGSAALFFSLKPPSATLGDLNGHLINALRQVRDRPKELCAKLARIPRTKEKYYLIRAAFNKSPPHGLTPAVYFVYLNRNCFNGLWRTNGEGAFNVPYGGTEMGAHPPLELFEKCSQALRSARLKHQDFRKTIAEAGANSFVYADPPYFTSSERTFVEYGRTSFGKDDLSDLIAALVAASNRGAHVVLTYNAAMRLRGIPREWSRRKIDVTRNVGGFKGARKIQTEILYTNAPLFESRE
jgi:DNA adenine methylase